jgi:hypothetical protein
MQSPRRSETTEHFNDGVSSDPTKTVLLPILCNAGYLVSPERVDQNHHSMENSHVGTRLTAELLPETHLSI